MFDPVFKTLPTLNQVYLDLCGTQVRKKLPHCTFTPPSFSLSLYLSQDFAHRCDFLPSTCVSVSYCYNKAV